MREQADRMAFLLRRNAGERRRPAFLVALTQHLGRVITPDTVLPLERGDTLWQLVLPSLHAARTQGAPAFSRWAPAARAALDAGLAALGTAVRDRSVVYLPSPELGIGPVPVALGEIAPHVRRIAEGATEECTIVTEDGGCGLRLDYHANDHEHGEPFPYELTVWGAPWQAVAARVLPLAVAAPAA